MSMPKCPHCGYEFDDEDLFYGGKTEFPTESDGDETETTCHSCLLPLKIQLTLTPSWTFYDGDDNQIRWPHD